MAVNIEDAGFQIRDLIFYCYGQGFPKSLDISKQLDKMAGKLGIQSQGFSACGDDGRKAELKQNLQFRSDYGYQYAPATSEAQQWNGWGTALKPSLEPVTVARRPIIGTVAENVLKYGTGGINVDGCRVGAEGLGDYDHWRNPNNIAAHGGFEGKSFAMGRRSMPQPHSSGRFPANLIHDGSDEVVGLFPSNRPGATSNSSTKSGHAGTGWGMGDLPTQPGYADFGSAARFFYCAKASKADRDEGLDGTCTIKYNIDSSVTGKLLWKDVTTVLVQLLQKVTSEDGAETKWNIGECGASIMGRCQSDSLSTTLMAISKITESRILSLLTHSLISESIADANCGTANGGSHVESVENLSKCQPTTTLERHQELARGVKAVVLPMLLEISNVANWKPATNIHSTVKPTALMRYLCRLVTPPGGIVLDPFMGSGSTGKAAVLENFNFIGIEREPEYMEIARRRIHAVQPMPEPVNESVTYVQPSLF